MSKEIEKKLPVGQPRIVVHLRNYLRQLDAHQRRREAALLIASAADEIERLHAACDKFSESQMLLDRTDGGCTPIVPDDAPFLRNAAPLATPNPTPTDHA